MLFERIKEIIGRQEQVACCGGIKGMSDEEIVASAQVYLAVYDVVTTCAADELLCDRAILKAKIRALYDECAARCSRAGASLEQRAALVEALYALCSPNLTINDAANGCCCDEVADSLVAEWLERGGDKGIQIGVLKAITELCYGMVSEDALGDEYMNYLQSVLKEWEAEQSERGEWPGVAKDQAFERINILDRNSFMMSDPTYDPVLERAQAFYGKQAKSEIEELCNEAMAILQEETINI